MILLVGLVAAALSSPVASGSDDVADQLHETDMDGSEFFHSPYHRGPGFGYDYGYPLNLPYGAGFGALPGVFPGVLPGVIPQHPFFYHK